jgi:hypothetical protein
MAGIDARIAADTTLGANDKAAVRQHGWRILRSFLSDAWNRNRIEKDFERVAAWADANGIERHRILMGECGVTRRDSAFTGADPIYRQRWLSDVTGIAQVNGFGWALWEINGREFGIQRAGDAERVDPRILAAVGMPR